MARRAWQQRRSAGALIKVVLVVIVDIPISGDNVCLMNTQAKPRVAGTTLGKGRARPLRYVLVKVKGDPTKVLARGNLPAGVEAIFAPNKADKEALSRAMFGDSATKQGENDLKPGPKKAGAPRILKAFAPTTGTQQPHTEGRKAGSRPVIDKDAFKPDARALALLRGRKIAEADLRAAGGAYDLEQVRTVLQGVSRQRVDKQVREGSLLAVPGPSNRRHYPTVQFQSDGTVVKGLKAVRAALQTQNPWAVLNFLVQADDRLNGRKPIEMLKAGKVEDVVDAARSMGQQGG